MVPMTYNLCKIFFSIWEIIIIGQYLLLKFKHLISISHEKMGSHKI